uniref:sentrin-specific protease 7 isoform X2 n=1 Tax=Scatophagus argus TaxID=75038 RepID=UPI001ED865DD|nr:sentrin-specific protease 7 isoform X2 [Scatophagus argus]
MTAAVLGYAAVLHSACCGDKGPSVALFLTLWVQHFYLVFLLCLTKLWTMMERRKALTIPFTIDKDKLMENPFRIPMTCVSSECGKPEKQVSWTEIAGCKSIHCDSQHKNGSVLFGPNHAAKGPLEMAGRKPCLILTDILKTELGKAYMERIKQNCTMGNGGQVLSARRECGQHQEERPVCRDRRSSQRVARNDKNQSVTPTCNQKTTFSPSQRSRLRRRLQNAEDNVDKKEKDIQEVIIGKDCEEDFVDCGLSVSWEPTEDRGGCDEFSPASIKDRWTDPEKEVQHSLKRKRKDAGSQCNGTGSPKRHRESVLRLSGENKRDGAPATTRICVGESGEDGDLESLDRSIVQFTVGADDPAGALVPIINPNLEAGDFIDTPKQSVLSSHDNTTKASPSEPIVLSSDDEESCDDSQHCSPALVTVEDTAVQGQSPQEAVTKEQKASHTEDLQLLRIVVDLPPMAVSLIPSVDYTGMALGFSTLHCGGYQGKSNGNIVIEDQKMFIPLTDINEQVEVILTFERKELRKYSVWEQQELEDQELHLNWNEEPSPPAFLLLCVSETAAAAVQKDLLKLCAKHDETTNTGKASPFILMTLRAPLEGMEGTLFRSLLEIDCLSSLADEQSIVPRDADGVHYLEDFKTPVLSLDDSIEMIRTSRLDSHLLSLLGLESTDPRLTPDHDGLHSDTDKNAAPLIQLDVDSQKETVLQLEAEIEQETETQLKPEYDHKEQELDHPSEKKDEPIPVYTLCHRRTRGSYCVSLCKPDSSWTKYKHQGLAHRLIQFPPPPLKGGITVTMEDLQCLDSGHFLNDVIIDFYLKYLLHKASAAVAERSHIFSSFFYKQLTRRDNASEGSTKDSCQRQRRHQRVKTWTRHVDIFKKDFLFVPVNQEAHWYLVVICFPGLHEQKHEAWNGPISQMGYSQRGTSKLQVEEVIQRSKSSNDDTESVPTSSTLNHSDNSDTHTEDAQEESTKDTKPGPVSCTERTYQKKTVCKKPCILVMDSLKRSLHERVFKLLRDYLESEWEVRRGSERDFGPDQMQSSHCRVPLQDNSSDCGLYLLQYVESFLEDPVVHFDLPLQLEHWFPRQQVWRKRDEIRDLVLNLYRRQNLDSIR